MNPVQTQISDLQEITFWQQINKQLIAKRNLGEPITDDNQKVIQKFCFDNQLFHRITEDPLIDEIPIALVSDLERVHALTYYIDRWNECLTSLLPNSISLDVEQAQADAFDAMTDLDRKYRFFETTPADIDADDDEELYAFIDEYNSMVENQGRELRNALRILYELKAAAISTIVKKYNGQKFVTLDRNFVLLDFKDSQNKDRIISLYHQDFCKEALTSISKFADATSAFLDMEILGLLDGKESEPNLKSSIQQFIEHERDLIERQSKLIKEFYNKLNQKINSTGVDQIKILNLSPFAFLKSPFPEV